MKLIFLGTGSAFTVGDDNYQSNLLLQSDDNKYLLLDCGSDVRFSLFEQGLNYNHINAVYISHLHADHVGGLEWLAFSTHFDENCKKPLLFLPDEIGPSLWSFVLKGGLRCIQNESATIKTFFKLKGIKKESSFRWEGITFKTVKTLHVSSNEILLPSYGLFFKIKKTKVFFTIDTQYTPEILMKYFLDADVIFHDCETSKVRTGVHAHFDDLKKLPVEIKKKMWLYHYNPGRLPNAVKAGFRGFVKKGQSFTF